jgi:capsular exopolysaccharide synthesis family protein
MRKVELEKLEDLSYGKKEAFNSLRTNLSFCGDDIQTIIFTSCTPDEGKSSTVIELGRALAEDGKKVLVIDADLRKSVLVGRHHAKSSSGSILGLSHYLTGQAKLEVVLNETNVENLDIIFAGRTTPNPTELLGNDYFANLIQYAREHYEIILIDSPPLGSVIDTAIIAPKCDGVVLVVEANKCSYRYIQDVKKQLLLTECRILGVVLNKVKVEKGGYYNRYYKGYYRGYYKGYYKPYYEKNE